MSRATLAVILSKLQQFPKPSTRLEQYPTPSEAAATILWDAHTRGLIQGKHVLDLGAGTGILGIGALLLGAAKVTFLEIDERLKGCIEDNLDAAKQELETPPIGTHDIIIRDAAEGVPPADLVLSNPPFGTKEKHADTQFLELAYADAKECYSFHKASTDSYLQEWFQKRGISIMQRFPFTFNLAPTMQQHDKQRHLVAITCWHTRKDL